MNSQCDGNKKTDREARSDCQPLSQNRGDTCQVGWLDKGCHDIEDSSDIDSGIQAGLFHDKFPLPLQKKCKKAPNKETNQADQSNLDWSFFIKHAIKIVRNGNEIPSHEEDCRDSHARENQDKPRNQEDNQEIKGKKFIRNPNLIKRSREKS